MQPLPSEWFRVQWKTASQWRLLSCQEGRLWLRLCAATYVGLGRAAGIGLALTSSAADVTKILHGNRWQRSQLPAHFPLQHCDNPPIWKVWKEAGQRRCVDPHSRPDLLQVKAEQIQSQTVKKKESFWFYFSRLEELRTLRFDSFFTLSSRTLWSVNNTIDGLKILLRLEAYQYFSDCWTRWPWSRWDLFFLPVCIDSSHRFHLPTSQQQQQDDKLLKKSNNLVLIECSTAWLIALK